MKFPFPVVLCDVGGTNARFALQETPRGPLSESLHLQTADFPGLAEAFAQVRPKLAATPASMLVCAAGTVTGRNVKMTNTSWEIDGAALARAAGLSQGLLLNDFEAQALSLPALTPHDCRAIGATAPALCGARVILGPGTGLGAAALIEVEGRHLALATEAGHVDFGPPKPELAAIWRHLEDTPFGRVSAEAIISGPGLLRLHKARLAAQGRAGAPGLDDPALIARAHADPAGDEATTVALFLDLAARFAADLAIIFIATGGITFSGGVLPRLAALIDDEVFRAAFEDKAPYDTLLRQIETRLIVAADTVLAGMGLIAAEPERYAIDYTTRAWC